MAEQRRDGRDIGRHVLSLNSHDKDANLPALGTHYEQFDAHYLATPLFVKALELSSAQSCHSVVLSTSQTPLPLPPS
jgi:hypothetical protein